MINTGAVIPAVLALLLAGTPLAAQVAGDAAGAPAQDTPEPGGEDTAQANSGQVSPGQASPGQASPTPDTTGDSPFDYESSEEISEDLSVSFPVDI